MPKKPGDGKGKHQRISFAPAPDPQSPMGRASGDDGAQFRAYPYLMSFVRPLVSGEFGDIRVVSPERLKVCTHVFVTRIDPTSVARTRIPLTPEQAAWQQAFGVLDLEEMQKAPKEMKQGPLSLPEDMQHCTILAAALGIYTAFQAYPHLERNETALESRASELANQRVHTWPEIVNDTEGYIRLFVPAYVFGHRYGDNMVQELPKQERARLLQNVCFQPPLDAQMALARVIQDHMREIGVNSIYDLH